MTPSCVYQAETSANGYEGREAAPGVMMTLRGVCPVVTSDDLARFNMHRYGHSPAANAYAW